MTPISRMSTSMEDGWRKSSRAALWTVGSVQRLPRHTLHRPPQPL